MEMIQKNTDPENKELSTKKYSDADLKTIDSLFKKELDAQKKLMEEEIYVKKNGGLQGSMGRDNVYFPQGIPIMPYMSHGEKETITMRTNFNHAKENRKHPWFDLDLYKAHKLYWQAKWYVHGLDGVDLSSDYWVKNQKNRPCIA